MLPLTATGCHQHRAANQHAATQRGHRNAKTAGIPFLRGQQVDTPAQLHSAPAAIAGAET
ncbi:hypothetical protein KPZU09_06530 [Klebsiella pneumoniae]|uniref:Uncharacterized protein n=1 Tax=Klebsiella pneumoniae TaxID=573 RepID=A0A919HNR7_KLEPN|nr:hypothetical protein KPZU09_06530 [Klebsiella pneumoniae]